MPRTATTAEEMQQGSGGMRQWGSNVQQPLLPQRDPSLQRGWHKASAGRQEDEKTCRMSLLGDGEHGSENGGTRYGPPG